MPTSADIVQSPHLKLTWGGEIGAPAVELWTNGLHLVDFESDRLPTDEELQEGVNAVAPVIQAWFVSGNMRIGDAARLVWAKLNVINEHGLQPGNTIRHDYPADVFGSFAQNPDWNQTFAMTFRTARQRGRGHAGRIYPPLVAYNPQAKSPYIDPVAANIMATATATLLNDITAALADVYGGEGTSSMAWTPAIQSPGLISKATTEVRERITSVVVDRVPDTQHRRTRQVPRAEGTPAVIPYT